MRFTIRPASPAILPAGFAVCADTAKDALRQAHDMSHHGLLDVVVTDDADRPYSFDELQQIAAEDGHSRRQRI